MGSLLSRSSFTLKRALFGFGILVVLILMVANTTFLNAAESAEANGPVFTAEAYAAEKFPEIAGLIEQNAIDVTTLAAAVDADPDAAGAQYGVSLGAGRFAYAVKATAKVLEVDENWMILDPAGLPPGADLRIPLGPALTGTPVRDATGTIAFGDFHDQTDYQSVANQFKLIITHDILEPLDLQSLAGKTVTVVGAMVAGVPANAYYIQPVALEVVE
ncbi:MAG: DUF2291 family protein [Acidimicrobiia bacterium]